MDTKKYISSGILESYILGIVSEQEQKEVQCLRSIYPEIQEELRLLENTMEQFALSQTVAPPPLLKKQVMDQLDTVVQLGKEENEENKTNIVPLNPVSADTNSSNKKSLWWAAASVLLFLTSGFLLFNNQQIKKQLISSENKQEKNAQLLVELENQTATLSAEATIFQKIKAENTATYPLKGTELYKEGYARVYWNKKSDEVFFQLLKAPSPPKNKQYQLWAIVDGKPVDIGVCDLENNGTDIQIMSKIKNPGAFAVTLENIGGSPTPTLEAMYLIAEISEL